MRTLIEDPNQQKQQPFTASQQVPSAPITGRQEVNSPYVPSTPSFGNIQQSNSTSTNATPQSTSSKDSWLDSHPWMKALWAGANEVIAQPVRATQQLGMGISDVLSRATGSSEQDIQKAHEFIQSGSDYNPIGIGSGGVKPYGEPPKNLEEAGGIALQAGANLSMGAMSELGVGGMALQGAASMAGGAMENDGSTLDVGTQGVIGGVTGIATHFLGKGASRLLSTGAKEAINTLGRIGQGLSESEYGTIKAVPKIVGEYYNKLISAGKDLVQQQKARQTIENGIFDQTRDAWNAYAEHAGNSYESQMAGHGKNLVENAPPISKENLHNDLVSLANKRGIELSTGGTKLNITAGATAEERAIIEKLSSKINKATGSKGSVVGDLGFNELNALRKDIGGLYDSVKPGSPEKSIVDDFYAQMKQRMMSLSKDPAAVQKTFDEYKQFLDQKGSFKKITSNKSDPATVRSGYLEIARALTGQKGSGEMSQAMAAAEKAGGLKPDELAYRLQGLGLASKLAGVRHVGTTEDMIAGGVEKIATKIPRTLPEIGATILKASAKELTDKTFMENLFKEAGSEIKPGVVSKVLRTTRNLEKTLGAILSKDKTRVAISSVVTNLLKEILNPSDQADPSQQ